MIDGTALTIERNHTEYGIYDEGSLDAGIIIDKINTDGSTSLTITADRINIDGVVTALASKNIGCANLDVQNDIDCSRNISADGYIYAGSYVWADSVRVGQSSTGATWQSVQISQVSAGTAHYFMYGSSSGDVDGVNYGRLITSLSNPTIYYLGR